MKLHLKHLLLLGAVASAPMVAQEISTKVSLQIYPVSNSVDLNALPTSTAIKSIPEPPLGERWVLNDILSDEFNGDKLDDSKWLNYHPTWAGREPGIFLKSQVKVEDGMLVLTGEKMAKDTIVPSWNGKKVTYNIRCAAVVSKKHDASYGYYESRIKANKTTLSTTFWMSKRDGKVSTEGRQPTGAEVGEFHQELDILECIGRTGNFSGKFFYEGMNSNVHYWFTPKGGSQQDIRAKETRLKLPNGEKPCDGFNVYGCWWRDKKSASFYLNNAQETTVEFENKKTGKPFYFTEKMGLNLVLETYPYPWIQLPNDKELADPTKNKNYYDWVRHYILVPVADAFEKPATDVFEEKLYLSTKPSNVTVSDGVKFNLQYTTNDDRKLNFVVYNAAGETVASEVIDAYAGYANRTYTLKSSNIEKGKTYYAVAYLLDGSNQLAGDHYSFKAQ